LYKLEGDAVAYKPPATTILDQFGKPAPLDTRVDDSNRHREFFAGENEPNNWIYCELKANFLDKDHATQVTNLAEDGKEAIEHKRCQIAKRFNIPTPRVVIMAYQFSDDSLKAIRSNDGWHYKNLGAMFDFMLTRFHSLWDSKGRIAYNDPWLDMVKHLAFLGYHRKT
jgi:hypothetical protein